MKKLAILLGVLFLVACASTPTADLYAGQVVLTKVEQSAYTYTTLPLCGTEKSGQLCRTLATERAIRKAQKTAEAALTAAKTAVSPGAVANFQTALNAFSALVPVVVQSTGDK